MQNVKKKAFDSGHKICPSQTLSITQAPQKHVKRGRIRTQVQSEKNFAHLFLLKKC